MRYQSTLWSAMLAAPLVLCVAGSAPARGTTDHAVGQNIAGTQFSAFPGLPACTPGSVKSGDPAKGASIILAKADTGCIVPWHWHSPNEHLMIVRGVVRLDMKGGESMTLRAGGYAMMPARHVHRFVCVRSCVFYVHSDAALDIHYVNDQGEEISPDDALKTASDAAAVKNK